MFSSKGFIILDSVFRSVICFMLIFVKGVRCGGSGCFFFLYRYLVVLQVVEKFSLIYYLGNFG